MPSGSRSRRRNHGRARSGHNDEPNTTTSGDKPTSDPINSVSTSKEAINKSLKLPTCDTNVHHANGEENLTAAVCWICAEPVKYYSLSACNHRTCHVCALRLRVLYKKLECTFCKEPQSTVIFTSSPDANFLSYMPDTIPYKDARLGIFFETEGMMEETLILLRFNCPTLDCDYTALEWNDLKLHARAVHGKMFCDLCIQFKKVFVLEHILYQPSDLPLHLPSIRHQSRKQPFNRTIEGGIHPLCEFCNECFFGDDELFVHMRKRHEECFLCKRKEIRDQYFQNYNSLELHFSETHFACTDPICQAQKFVVFDSGIDLNAHRLEVHGENMSLNDKKSAQQIQVKFEYDGTGSSSSRGGKPRESIEEYTVTESTRTTARSAPSGRATSVGSATPKHQTNETSAHDLISTVWKTLDQNLCNTATIINAVIDFLKDEEEKHDLLAAWNKFGIDPEQRHPPLESDPTTTRSGYTRIASGRPLVAVHATPSQDSESQQSVRVEHYTAQTASPSSSTSPSLIRPCNINTNVTPVSHQSQQPRSWASVAALSPLPSAIIPKRTDEAQQPLILSVTQGQQSPSLADANVMPGFYYNRSQSPHTWALLASTDLSAWTPNWEMHRGESSDAVMEAGTSALTSSSRSETMMGQGRKAKGKQKQRVI